MGEEKDILKSTFADTDSYDRRLKRFVPYNEEMLNSVLRCIYASRNQLRVLELGCGTGNLSKKLLEINSDCWLTAIDLQEEMVMTCSKNLGRYSRQTEVICADMIGFQSVGNFDFVISNLALHYPDTDQKKVSVCRNAFMSLKPGGIFSFSIMIRDEPRESADYIFSKWERDVLCNGVSQEEFDEWQRTCHKSDYPIPASLWMKWLKEIGFLYSRLTWQKTIFGTICARKPGVN